MTDSRLDAFIVAAVVPRDAWHASGTLEPARGLLDAHPELARASIYTAAILGDGDTVRRLLADDAASATAKGGPYGWDALTHLCFSRFLRLDRDRSEGFLAAATALLDGGAGPNTGFFEGDHAPHPEWESVLYGAAGVAHHPELTRLLVERGAEVNDGEVTYHSPETYDLDALKILVETGRLTDDSLCTMLVRKHDWHDGAGVRYLLHHGADPNRMSHWGMTPLWHAIKRDNALNIVELLLGHGADPGIACHGHSAIALAARRGRGDLLSLFARHGLDVRLEGVDGVLAACAQNDAAFVQSVTHREPDALQQLIAGGGTFLAEFAGNDNATGTAHLLNLGVDVRAPFAEGDGYWGVARNSTALHVAAWRASHATVRVLLDRGADVHALDGTGRTPLALAVKASVDSHWMEARTPDSVRALLEAGASADGVGFPSGYAEVDELLRAAGAAE